METIKLLDGSVHDLKTITEKARDDNFYYSYLGKHAFSSSILKMLLDSPKKYYYYTRYGNEQESSALNLGRIIHAKALTPEIFDKDYEVVQVQSKNTNKFKEAKANSNRYCITLKEDSDANRVVDALLKNDTFISKLANSQPEEPAIGEIMGYPFRAKADILRYPELFDLKTTADLRAFPYSAKKYSYDLQVFIYCTLFNIDPYNFEFLVIDKGSLDIGLYKVDKSFFDSGRDKCERALDVYTNFFLGKSEDEILEGLNNYIFEGILE